VTGGERGFRARPLYSGEIDSAGGSIASEDNPAVNYTTLPKSVEGSLTYSEDSETTRIYNLNTRETKLLPASASDVEKETNSSPVESPVRVQAFFRTSPKRLQEIRKMDDDVTTVIRTSNPHLINGDSAAVSC